MFGDFRFGGLEGGDWGKGGEKARGWGIWGCRSGV